jgi:hypothetical protein
VEVELVTMPDVLENGTLSYTSLHLFDAKRSGMKEKTRTAIRFKVRDLWYDSRKLGSHHCQARVLAPLFGLDELYESQTVAELYESQKVNKLYERQTVDELYESQTVAEDEDNLKRWFLVGASSSAFGLRLGLDACSLFQSLLFSVSSKSSISSSTCL